MTTPLLAAIASAAPTYIAQERFVEASLQSIPFGSTELSGPIERIEATDFGAFDAVTPTISRDEPPGPPLGGAGQAFAGLRAELTDAGVQARLTGSANLGEGQQFTPPFDAETETVVSTTFTLDSPHAYSIQAFDGDFAVSRPPLGSNDPQIDVDGARFDSGVRTSIGRVDYTIGLSGPGVDVAGTPIFAVDDDGEFFLYDPFFADDKLPDGRPMDFVGTLGAGTYTFDLRLLVDEGVGLFEYDIPASLSLTEIDDGSPAVVPLPSAAWAGLGTLGVLLAVGRVRQAGRA